MNEKEAREIVKRGQSWKLKKDEVVTLGDVLERSISVVEQYSGAKKYLEAIEKANPLVEEYKFLLKIHEREGGQWNKSRGILAQWEKEK